MALFKEQWNLEMALEVLNHKTVDSRTWADAAKWLMLYGPPEIQEVLNQASHLATHEIFPGIGPRGFDDEGNPWYDVNEIAEALGISEQEAMGKMAELQAQSEAPILFGKRGSGPVH